MEKQTDNESNAAVVIEKPARKFWESRKNEGEWIDGLLDEPCLSNERTLQVAQEPL